MSYGSELRALIERDEILFCPGVHDPLGARVVNEFEYDAVYMTGYGTSVSKIGYPDAGFITMPEMIENAKNVQQTVDVPIIADADNGFGDVKNTIRTVREYTKTDVAGIHIEDQIFPKRCGHVKGKEIIPFEEAVGKYRAASDFRDDEDEEFVIIARTDARGASDGTLDDAIERANAYCEAGADVAFVEGPVDEGEVKYIGENVPAPLLYNYGTMSPRLTLDELEDYGYDLAIYAGLTHKSAMISMFKYVEKVQHEGRDGFLALEEELDELPIENYHTYYGFSEVVEWEEEYLPAEYMEKYETSVGDSINE